MASPHDSQPASTTIPKKASDQAEDSSGELIGDGAAEPAGGSGTRAWALTLAIAMAAGLIAWAGGEWKMIPEIASGGRGGAPRVLTDVAATRNAIVSFTILGAALGLGLGLAGGLMRRSVLWTLLAATIGLGLGGLTGFEVSQFSIPYYYAHMKADDLVYSLQVHGGTWAAIGAVAGLAFGLGRGPWRRYPDAYSGPPPGRSSRRSSTSSPACCSSRWR